MISKQEVQHIAKLARISLTPEEEEKFQKELSSILDYIKKLEQVDTSRVKPAFHSLDQTIGLKGQFSIRQDKPKEKDTELSKKLIDSAPQKQKSHIKVKSIFKN